MSPGCTHEVGCSQFDASLSCKKSYLAAQEKEVIIIYKSDAESARYIYPASTRAQNMYQSTCLPTNSPDRLADCSNTSPFSKLENNTSH